MTVDIRDHRVLVTGASRGIGEALARHFAAAGGRVALVARSPGPLEELAAELSGAAFPADLADPEQVCGLIARVEARGGPVDILVNNAGVGTTGDFARTPAEELEQLYRVNLLAPVLLCRQVLPGMLERGGGHVVNVSSVAALGVFPGSACYCSSKAGLSHFTAGLRADLRSRPVGTTLVELGPVDTDLLERACSYLPIQRSYRRFYQLQLFVNTDRDEVARQVVTAVQQGRRHVRLPRRTLALALLTEAPRRTVEWLLAGVPHQD